MADLLDLIQTRKDAIARLEAEIRDRQAEIDAHRRELAQAYQALAPLTAIPTIVGAGKTSTAMAEDVLRRAGHPLHVNEIMRAIEDHFGTTVKYATLVGNISRLIKRGNLFTREGKNIFGLLEWAETRKLDELFGEEQHEDGDLLRGEHDHGR